MLKLTVIKVLSISFVLILIALVWPIYNTFAHKGKISFPPFYQFTEIPKNNPTDQKLYNEAYKESANEALALIIQHKNKINAPAISSAVAINGELVWAGVAGWADIDAKKIATTDTQFRIGSTSKALTATALARLVDANVIDIDKPISNYIKELPNKNWHNMTARQLVSHTAGLPHYKDNTDYLGLYKTLTLSTRYENVEDALSVFDESDLLFEPGEQFSYSSFGTVLLSNVMEHAAATPYLEIMNTQIFEPLEINSTMAEFSAENSKNLATFYWNNKGKSFQVRPWREVDLSHRLAGGGFISTSSDLVKVGSAFLQDDFISDKTRKSFWTPQTLPDGTKTPNGYALGWRFMTIKVDEEFGEITLANHGGVSRGAQSWLMVIPKHNMSIAVNINANTDEFWDFGKVSMQIAKIFILAKMKII